MCALSLLWNFLDRTRPSEWTSINPVLARTSRTDGVAMTAENTAAPPDQWCHISTFANPRCPVSCRACHTNLAAEKRNRDSKLVHLAFMGRLQDRFSRIQKYFSYLKGVESRILDDQSDIPQPDDLDPTCLATNDKPPKHK